MKALLVVSAILMPLLFVGAFVLLYRSATLDVTSTAAVLGALAGALGGVMIAPFTVLVTIWNRNQESKIELAKTISSHAIELTRLDYDLRLKAVEGSGQTNRFLAPAKVYRELYRAMLSFHQKDAWPATVQELGLLNVIEIDANAQMRREHRIRCLEVLREFVNLPMQNLHSILHSGPDQTEDVRVDLLKPVTEWIDKYRTLMPRNIERAMVTLERMAGSAVSSHGHQRLQMHSAERYEEQLALITAYYGELRREFEGST